MKGFAYIDKIKGLVIILVVIGHLLAYSLHGANGLLHNIIYYSLKTTDRSQVRSCIIYNNEYGLLRNWIT
ncbi:hypothetical protein [Segatella buccae]